MTSLRQSAIMELEKIPEDKLIYVLQILKAVNGIIGISDEKSDTKLSKLE